MGSTFTDSIQIDGSLTGETNPIRPLIVPSRKLDLVIVYEASSDSTNDWVNGTNLISKFSPRPFYKSTIANMDRHCAISLSGQHTFPRNPNRRYTGNEEFYEATHLLWLQY